MAAQTLLLTGGATVSAIGSDQAAVSDSLLLKSFAGLYFDIVREHSISVQNQITDNYIENNTAIQDHIAQTPILVSLSGLSGELVYTPPQVVLNKGYSIVNTAIQGIFNNAQMADTNILTDKLTVIPALLPPVDNITQTAKNTVQYIEASAKRYIKIVKNFTSDTQRESRLQQIYNDLIELRGNNVLLTVETPYTTFTNMAIQSLILKQGELKYSTDIELTLKQINFAQTYTTQPDTSIMAQYNAIPRTEEANHGKAQGVTEDNRTLLKSISGVEYSGVRR